MYKVLSEAGVKTMQARRVQEGFKDVQQQQLYWAPTKPASTAADNPIRYALRVAPCISAAEAIGKKTHCLVRQPSINNIDS